MSAQNALKLTIALVLVAACVLSTVPRPDARSPEPAASATAAAPGEDPVGHEEPDDSERAFDSSITVPELFDKAREAFGLQAYNLAETFYQEILIRERSNVQAMLELANVYERSGKLEYARGLLARSAKLAPSNHVIAKKLASVERILVAVLSEEVDSLIAASQYELAIPKLSVHVSIEPDNSELFYKRALCYSRLGQPEAALANIDKALQIDPREEYYRLRSAILDDLKVIESTEMVAEAKKLIQSDDPEDQRRALDVLGQILQADPEHAWARSEFRRLRNLEDGVEADRPGEDSLPADANGITAILTAVGTAAGELGRRHLGAVLVLLATLVIFQSRLTRLIIRMLAPRPFLSGRFPRFTLTEVLVMLNSESHTGVLHVKGDSCRGKIYFENGEPCHCSVGKTQGVGALHHLMSNTATGHFEFSEGSIPLRRTIDTPLTVVLLEDSAGRSSLTGGRKKPASRKSKKAKSRMKEMLEKKPGKQTVR
jgi:tetratricopeptide (TPR) repeat protein